MTDDIVTKLEFLLQEGAAIIEEQAEEIERLRAENDGLRIRIYTLLKELQEQAVRGE